MVSSNDSRSAYGLRAQRYAETEIFAASACGGFCNAPVNHLVERGVPHGHEGLPDLERYGLQSQLRRAAVSTATNIVEGCARRGQGEYCQFLSIAHGSSREASYVLTLCARPLANDYDRAAAMLLGIINSLS